MCVHIVKCLRSVGTENKAIKKYRRFEKAVRSAELQRKILPKPYKTQPKRQLEPDEQNNSGRSCGVVTIKIKGKINL